MVIHQPEMKVAEGTLCLSARVELQHAEIDLPERIWYQLPDEYEEEVDIRLESFVISLLMLAMRIEEPIVARGALSPRLVYGLREYQRAFHQWLPDRFTPVSISCAEYAPLEAEGEMAGTAFSGGADSFYTLWSHLPEREDLPAHRVSHALFVHGFDIPLEDTRSFEIARASYAEMMRRFGITLIPIRTNVRAFLQPVPWKMTYGCALIGTAHLVSKLFSTFYVPSGHTYREAYPTGTDARIDSLLSSERLEVIHSGSGATRVEKLVQLSTWAETHDKLRVCWRHPNGLENCSRCEKCVRTMIPLEITGHLPDYTTFAGPLLNRHLRKTSFPKRSNQVYAKQLIDHAESHGRIDVAGALRYALLRSRLTSLGPDWQELRGRLALRTRLRRFLNRLDLFGAFGG